jgi:hypothetical protein
MLAAGLRYLRKRFAGSITGFKTSNISERNNAGEPLVPIDNGQSSDLNVTHVPGYLFEVLVFEAVFDVFGHGLLHERIRSEPHGHTTRHDRRSFRQGDHRR